MEDLDKHTGQNETYGYNLLPAEFNDAILDYNKSRLGKEITSSDSKKLKKIPSPHSQGDRLGLNK